MTFDEIILNRRSVRDYDDRPVPAPHVTALIEAARWAPSACNSQTWRFIAVTGKDRIQRICGEGMRPIINNKWMRQAPLVIVACSKLDVLANRIGSGISGIEYYAIDLGIAVEHLVLKATELGLGTCWVGWFNEPKLKEILHIPPQVRAMAIISVGYAKDAPPKKRARRKLGEILYAEEWGCKWKDTP